MKKISRIVSFLVILALVFIVYKNYDTIVNYIVDIYDEKKDVVLKEPNEYKRNYNYVTFNNSNEFILLNKDQIQNVYYNILNNGWDSFVFYCDENYESCIDDIKELSTDDRVLSNINNYISPFNGFKEIKTLVSSTGQINITITKNYSEIEIQKINEKIDELIIELDLKSLSQKEQITKIHDYIIHHTTYDKEKSESGSSKYNSSKASGVLFEGHAVCAGYSDTMALFLDKLSIPNLKISTENHIWNLVFVDNAWKHVDITWDDDDKNKKAHSAFLLIDSKKIIELDKDEHTFDTNYFKEASL